MADLCQRQSTGESGISSCAKSNEMLKDQRGCERGHDKGVPLADLRHLEHQNYSSNNQSILKEINTEYSLEGLMMKLKLQYLDHIMQRANSLQKTLMLGEIEGKRRRE